MIIKIMGKIVFLLTGSNIGNDCETVNELVKQEASIDWHALNGDTEGGIKIAAQLIKYFKENGYEFKTLS